MGVVNEILIEMRPYFSITYSISKSFREPIILFNKEKFQSVVRPEKLSITMIIRVGIVTVQELKLRTKIDKTVEQFIRRVYQSLGFFSPF